MPYSEHANYANASGTTHSSHSNGYHANYTNGPQADNLAPHSSYYGQSLYYGHHNYTNYGTYTTPNTGAAGTPALSWTSPWSAPGNNTMNVTYFAEATAGIMQLRDKINTLSDYKGQQSATADVETSSANVGDAEFDKVGEDKIEVKQYTALKTTLDNLFTALGAGASGIQAKATGDKVVKSDWEILKSKADQLVSYGAAYSNARSYYAGAGHTNYTDGEYQNVNWHHNYGVYGNTCGGNRCLALDTKVDIVNGKSYTILEMIKKYENKEEMIIYSCDLKTGKIIQSIVTWAGITHRNVKMIELELDNGNKARCTPDHLFPTTNKGLVEAKNLNIDSSIIGGHKFVSLKHLEKTEDVGSLIIKNDYHTFRLSAGVFTSEFNA